MIALKERLLSGAAALDLELDAGVVERLLTYVDELLNWNRRINLTAITDPHEVMVQHILDSLSILPWLESGHLLDVGSGGGLPGLPLAVVRPDLRVTSIDSRNKKISFQRHAARALGLGNFAAVCARVEQWQPAEPFAQIVSRAFSSLTRFAQLAGPHLASGGHLLAMKGRVPQEELAEVSADWEVVRMPRLSVPGLAAERHLIVLGRLRAE